MASSAVCSRARAAGGGCSHGGQPPLGPHVKPGEIILQTPLTHPNAEWPSPSGMGCWVAAHGAGFICPHSRDGYGNGQTSSGTIQCPVQGCQGAQCPSCSRTVPSSLEWWAPSHAMGAGSRGCSAGDCIAPTAPGAPCPPKHLCEFTGLGYSWVDICQEGRLHPNTNNSQRVAPAFSPHSESNSLGKKYLYSPIFCRRHLNSCKFRKGTHLHLLAPGPHP